VPLKILLADDSMTAQKMGKEILLSAGYEVIAVSNGAAAAKKLAEKPDICVLDIIMPGYTGIEVCEKIRASIETAKMPVLLTVGKMEHYEQKEVQRVAADGVIVKPFEATDLLATIQKFVDKLNAPKAAAAAASREKTIAFTPPSVEEFKDDSYNQWKTEAEVHDDGSTGEMPAAKKAAAMEVPSEAASAPAFMDFGSSEPAAAPPGASPSRDKTVLITPPDFAAIVSGVSGVAAAPAPAVEFAPVAPAIPGEETSAGMPAFDLGFGGGFAAAPVEPAPAPPAPPAADHALEFTAHAPVEVNPSILGGFEATAHAPVEVRGAQDPNLASGTEGFDSFRTKIGTDDVATAEFAAVASDATAATEEDEFEKRVAAAMSELEEPAAEAQSEAAIETAPLETETAPSYEHTQKMSIPDFAREPEAEVAQPSAYSHTADAEIMHAIEPPAHVGDTQVMQSPIEIEHQTPSAPHIGDTAVMETSPVGLEPQVEAPTHIGDTAVMQAVPEGMVDAALVEQMQAAVANLPVEASPDEDTQELPAVVESAPAPAPVNEAPRQDLELAKALAAAVGAEAPVAAVTASSEHPEDVHEIAHTVKGVFERMLPNIMEEVKRELAKRPKK
jgi:CheY-like chemotaxis protein